jgi:hypothetical protein
VQQVLGRVRTGVGAEQDRGLTGVQGERLCTCGDLVAGGVEVLDRRAVVRATEPLVAGPEAELGDLGLGL